MSGSGRGHKRIAWGERSELRVGVSKLESPERAIEDSSTLKEVL